MENQETVNEATVREFKIFTKKLESLEKRLEKIPNLEAQLKTAQKKLKRTNPLVSDDGEHIYAVDEVRIFALGLYKQIELAIGQLDSLRRKHNNTIYSEGDKGKAEAKIVARALYMAATAATKLGLDLSNNIYKDNPQEYLGEEFELEDFLTNEEKERYLKRAQELIDHEKETAIVLQYDVDAVRPAKKGAPNKYEKN